MIALLSVAAYADTWALRERLVSEVRPPFSRWTEAVSESVWLVDWTPGEATMTARLCSVVSAPVAGAQSVFPQVDVARQRPVQFDGTAFGMGPMVEVMGNQDDDRDGNPGISVQISHPRIGSGEAFVRQAATFRWSGNRQADGRITGTMEYAPSQEVLGATTWWLKWGTPIRATTGSTFELVPVAAASCDAVTR